MNKSDIDAVILAGGRAQRMQGQDKGLIVFKQKLLIAHVADALKNTVDSIWVSANRNLDAYQAFGQVLSDELSDFQGPLAGIVTALKKTDKNHLLVVPCDGPYLHPILLERLAETMLKTGAKSCVAVENGHMHPTFALIHTDMREALEKYLDSGERRLGKFFSDHQAQIVDFSDDPQLFINLNSPEDFTTNA